MVVLLRPLSRNVHTWGAEVYSLFRDIGVGTAGSKVWLVWDPISRPSSNSINIDDSLEKCCQAHYLHICSLSTNIFHSRCVQISCNVHYYVTVNVSWFSRMKDTVNALSSSWYSWEPLISRLLTQKKQFPSLRMWFVASGSGYSVACRSGISLGAGNPNWVHWILLQVMSVRLNTASGGSVSPATVVSSDSEMFRFFE